MYLIDTSVWIDYFRHKDNPATQLFIHILDNNIPFGITSVIFQEILQGAANNKELTQLNSYLCTQRFFYPKDQITTYHAAAQIYFNCRRQGLTIRSTIDCLIAQIAIEHDLMLVHNDSDFLLIQKANAKLQCINNDNQ